MEELRLYESVRNLGLVGGLSLQSEFMIPGFSLSLGNAVKVGLFVTPSISLTGKGSMRFTKRVELDKGYSLRGADIGFGLSGGLQIGAKFEVLPGLEAVEIEISAYGKGAVSGGVNYEYYTYKPDNLKASMALEPVVAGVYAKVQVKKWVNIVLMDAEYEYSITEKIEMKSERRF